MNNEVYILPKALSSDDNCPPFVADVQTPAFYAADDRRARCVVCALPVEPAEFNVCKAHAGVTSAEFGAALKDNR